MAGSWCCHLFSLASVHREGTTPPNHVIRQHKQDKMATKMKLGVLFCLFHCCFSFGIFDDLLGDTDKCEDICSNTYPLHTYEKVGISSIASALCSVPIFSFRIFQPELLKIEGILILALSTFSRMNKVNCIDMI